MTSNYSVLENVAVEDDKFCVVKNTDNSRCVKFSLNNVEDNDRTIYFPNSDETIGHPKANNIETGDDNVNITTTSGVINIGDIRTGTNNSNENINIGPGNSTGTITIGNEASTSVDINALEFVVSGINGDNGYTIAGNTDNNSITLDTGSLSLDSTDTTNLTMTANDSSTKTLTITASNVGTGGGRITINGGDGVDIQGNASEIDLTTTGNIDINGNTIDITGTGHSGFTTVGALTLNGNGGITLESADTTNLTMTANDSSTKTLTITASNVGTGNSTLDINAEVLEIDSTDTTNLTMTAEGDNEKVLTIQAINNGSGNALVKIQSGGRIDLTPSNRVKITTGDLQITTGDILLKADTRSIKLGANSDVTLEHVTDTGLILKGPSNPELQFTDANYYIRKNSTTLELKGTSTKILCGASTGLEVKSNNNTGTITLINGASQDNTYSLKVNGNSQILGYIGITSSCTILGICYANSYQINSDDRLKENEVLITDATATLKKLKPQTYLKKESMDTTDTSNAIEESGLISQDIYYEAPELRHLITLADDASPASSITIPDDPTQDPDYSSWGSKPSSVNYTGLIPYLVKSIQELSARIDTLETP